MIVKSITKLLIISVILASLTSCATAIQGKTQQVSIQTNPPGAQLIIDGQVFGQTPMTIHLTRKHNHSILILKEGFQEQRFTIGSRPSFLLAANLIPASVGASFYLAATIFSTSGTMGGLIGAAALTGGACMGWDIITGGGYTLKQSKICIPLMPK